jgi:hypothetical protein
MGTNLGDWGVNRGGIAINYQNKLSVTIFAIRDKIYYIKYRGITMNKILISVPNQLVSRLKAAIPQRQRSKVIVHLIEIEIEKREKMLYECAMAVEKDHALNDEMKEWDTTLQDGLKHESW